MNPFVHLYEQPVAALTALAYVLVLASVTLAIAGELRDDAGTLMQEYQTRDSATNGRVGQWGTLPPRGIWYRTAWMAFLLAVETALIGGIIHVTTTGL